MVIHNIGMAGKLRTFQTSIGFFDLAIAAPSMKAALEAWGANSNLFRQGFAKEVKDPSIVAATMAKPDLGLMQQRLSEGGGGFHYIAFDLLHANVRTSHTTLLETLRERAEHD